MTSSLLGRIRLLAGLLMVGQGLLVVTRILDHEAPRPVGLLLLLAGGALVALPALLSHARARDARTRPLPEPGSAPDPSREAATGAPPARADAAAVSPARQWLVAGLGLFALVGTLAYNLLARSSLSTPELAILLYGAALVAVAPVLDRRAGPVGMGTLVAYSFPLVLAPLGLYAVNAVITSGVGATPLGWYIRYLLVVPMAALLGAGGVDARMLGDTVALATPRGALFLTVGVVCAGLYAGAIFLGIFGLFAWEQNTPPRRLAAYLALGLAGLHLANVLRLALLGYVGYKWGGEALQTFHQHAGWVLFLVWTILFWALVLRRFEGPGRRAAG